MTMRDLNELITQDTLDNLGVDSPSDVNVEEILIPMSELQCYYDVESVAKAIWYSLRNNIEFNPFATYFYVDSQDYLCSLDENDPYFAEKLNDILSF